MPLSRLADMITCSAYEQAEHYLSQLSSTSQEDLFEELTGRDEKGMTPLYQAVDNVDFNMVKVLLSFDASTEAKVKGKNVEEYAKELMESSSEDERLKKIYALMKSRGRWQSAVAREQGLLFSRSMKAVEDIVRKIEGVAQQVGFLFFGLTGEGKSTLINYLSGVDYEQQVTHEIKRVIPLSQEIVRTGNSTTSETLYPQVVKWGNRQQVLVDLAGFGDTRGTSEEICAAASIILLTKQLRAIQAIFLVCSWDSLKDSRMLKYREAAHHIGTMISADLTTAENVILVVTKPTSKTTVEFVKQRLLTLTRAENWSELKQINRDEVSEDTWKKYCLRNVTESILSREESIIVTDVTTPKTREIFQKAVDALERQSKSPTQFDFCNYSRFLERFKNILIKHMQHYIEMIYQHDDLSKLLDKKINAMNAAQSQLTMMNNEYAQLYQWCHTPFNSALYLLNIKKMRDEISKQKTFLSSCYVSKQSFEESMRIKRNRLVDLKTSHERNTNMFDHNTKMSLFHGTNFNTRGSQKEIQEISVLLEASHDMIQYLQKEIQEIQESIANIQQSIWNTRDRIQQEECNIIAEENKMAYAKAMHEAQIAIYYARAMEIYKGITKLNEDINTLLSEQAKIRQEIHLCAMEQIVNEDLFSKIYTINQVLDFNNDVVNLFTSLFTQRPAKAGLSLL